MVVSHGAMLGFQMLKQRYLLRADSREEQQRCINALAAASDVEQLQELLTMLFNDQVVKPEVAEKAFVLVAQNKMGSKLVCSIIEYSFSSSTSLIDIRPISLCSN